MKELHIILKNGAELVVDVTAYKYKWNSMTGKPAEFWWESDNSDGAKNRYGGPIRKLVDVQLDQIAAVWAVE